MKPAEQTNHANSPQSALPDSKRPREVVATQTASAQSKRAISNPRRKSRIAVTLFEPEFAGGLPVFDSMIQCEAQAHIPLSIQKTAKKKGCDAFKSNRVYLKPLLKWIFSSDDDATKNWRAHYDKYHALREEMRCSHEAAETLKKDEVHFAVSKGTNLLFSLLDRMANVELPPDLKGKDERGCQLALLQAVEKAKQAFIAGLGEIGGNGK